MSKYVSTSGYVLNESSPRFYIRSFVALKGELGELEFYFREIPLHQQKVLVVSVLSNSSWLQRNLKNGPK